MRVSDIITKQIFCFVSRILPDAAYLKLRYRFTFHRSLNLKNPQTYNEKLQWIKLYNRNPYYVSLVDKFEVKKYIDEMLGEGYTIPTLGIWECFDDINFESLPEQFVLKCTHDSGSVYICRDKSQIDKKSLKNKFVKSLKHSQFWGGREWVYKEIKPRIIAEEFMIDDSGIGLKDYKFFCFNGKMKAMFVATERGVEGTDVKFDFFDANYTHLPLKHGHENASILPPKPEKYEEMIRLSEKLAKNFPHVRVDLYNINGRIYFGEFTFYHHCGFVPFTPEEWDYKFGSWIDLNK